METKYVHTAWAENFISKEDAEDIMDTLGCCDEDKKMRTSRNGFSMNWRAGYLPA